MAFSFFFDDTATSEIYTLSLHDALPICLKRVALKLGASGAALLWEGSVLFGAPHPAPSDRKSTRLNSSHTVISYAVFCLKKKKQRCLAKDRWRTIGIHERRTKRGDIWQT